MQHTLSIILRILALVVIYTVLMTVGTSLTTPREVAGMLTPEQAAVSASMLPLVSLIMVLMLSYLALRSRWHGWKLAGALFLIYFILQAFLGWIEVFAFPAVGNRMPPGMQTSMLTTSLVTGIPFSLLAVWILGKTRPDPADARLPRRLVMPASEWAWKLVAAAALYMIVYFTFGYYVAWRTPGLPEFYGGSDPGTFLGQLGNVLRETPWLFPFQFLRGLIWAGIGCLIVAMHKGRTWEVTPATGLAFTVLMNAAMLFPNPFFTPVVQRAHTIELLTSNLLYGILLVLLLTWHYGSRMPRVERRAAAAQ
jgi:hypothetical protein